MTMKRDALIVGVASITLFSAFTGLTHFVDAKKTAAVTRPLEQTVAMTLPTPPAQNLDRPVANGPLTVANPAVTGPVTRPVTNQAAKPAPAKVSADPAAPAPDVAAPSQPSVQPAPPAPAPAPTKQKTTKSRAS